MTSNSIVFTSFNEEVEKMDNNITLQYFTNLRQKEPE